MNWRFNDLICLISFALELLVESEFSDLLEPWLRRHAVWRAKTLWCHKQVTLDKRVSGLRGEHCTILNYWYTTRIRLAYHKMKFTLHMTRQCYEDRKLLMLWPMQIVSSKFQLHCFVWEADHCSVTWCVTGRGPRDTLHTGAPGCVTRERHPGKWLCSAPLSNPTSLHIDIIVTIIYHY